MQQDFCLMPDGSFLDLRSIIWFHQDKQFKHFVHVTLVTGSGQSYEFLDQERASEFVRRVLKIQ